MSLELIQSARRQLGQLGGTSFLLGVAIATSFTTFIHMPQLRGPFVIDFLSFFSIAAIAYFIGVLRLKRDSIPIAVIWSFAILFRLILLNTTPSLSDDVYRYIWDGHLVNQGVNPYSFPVSDPALDNYHIPMRELVNHNWMASPYLPAAQLLFFFITRLAPQSIISFQITTVFLDLFTAWLIMDLLDMLNLPRASVLIYLWNPMVAIEFAHGAHIDAWMLFLTMLAFWFIVRAYPDSTKETFFKYLSACALAAATLTKGLLIIVVPLFLRRWKTTHIVLYAALLIIPSLFFAYGAGFGWIGTLDGRGLFGALRIYLSQWNFNSSLYHWLEISLTGIRTPGAVPVNSTTQIPIQISKMISGSLLGAATILSGVWVWLLDKKDRGSHQLRSLYLLRLALIPLGAYLICTATVHPWYTTLVVPFLPFLSPTPKEKVTLTRFIWPFIYLSCAVVFSYLTYLNPDEFHEISLVQKAEYLPFYLLMLWASWPFMKHYLKKENQHERRLIG